MTSTTGTTSLAGQAAETRNWICPRVDQAAARERFERRRFNRLRRVARAWGIHRPPPAPPRGISRELPHLTLVWLPQYLLSFDVVEDRHHATTHLLVGGYEPQVTLIELRGISWQAPSRVSPFSPIVSLDEARRAAQRTMATARLRNVQKRGRYVVSPHAPSRLVYYPYWAYYFARRAGMLDVRLLDALSGKSVGPGVKTSLLSALAGPR